MAGGGTAVNKNGIVNPGLKKQRPRRHPVFVLINGTAYVEGDDLGGGVVIQDAAIGLFVHSPFCFEGIDIPAQCTHADTEFFRIMFLVILSAGP